MKYFLTIFSVVYLSSCVSIPIPPTGEHQGKLGSIKLSVSYIPYANPDRKELINFIDCIKQCKENKGRLFVLGVGGSAANASHAVNDFRKICGIETYSVSENVAELTARINDESWKTCYTNWLKVSNLSKNDVLMVFSVGGGSDTTSQNLVDAMLYGKSIGSKIVSIVSRDGGIAKKESDACVLIPVINNSRITPHAEEWQGVVLHLVVNYLSYEH